MTQPHPIHRPHRRAFLIALFFVWLAPPLGAQSTVRVSESSSGTEGNSPSSGASLSRDGHWIAFESFASNLVQDDKNGLSDVFVHNRITGVTQRVSISPTGEEADDLSRWAAISPDGRFLVFESFGTNLVANDTNGVSDVFLRDRDPDGNGIFDEGNGSTSRASVSSTGAEADVGSTLPAVSEGGTRVAFISRATTLVPDAITTSQVFVRDVVAQTTELVSVNSSGSPADRPCSFLSISGDGTLVAYQSSATNLVAGDSNGQDDIFVRDLTTDETTRVSVSSLGEEGDRDSSRPRISLDGRYVSFVSAARSLVPDDTNFFPDVFVHDRKKGTTIRVSVSSTGEEGNGESFWCSRLVAGRFVAFLDNSTNLTAINGDKEVYLRDLLLGTTVPVGRDATGILGHGGTFKSGDPVFLSEDGRFVGFGSDSPHLVLNDANGTDDLFVRDLKPAASGGVDGAIGLPQDVLFVEDESRFVRLGTRKPIRVTLNAPIGGPATARFVLWVWAGQAIRQVDLLDLGCTVNPTPLTPARSPQPIRCLRGAGMPNVVCIGVQERTAPSSAPFELTANRGLSVPGVFTLQALLENDAAQGGGGFSFSNAVQLRVE